MISIQKFHPCQIFTKKMHAYTPLLHPMGFIGPLSYLAMYFMQCSPTLARGHCYKVMVVDYFMKWTKFMTIFTDDENIISLLMFNHIIPWFGVPKVIVTDHGSNFCNKRMTKLSTKMGFHQENSSPYYPQSNQ